jgi:hypothetical protein
MPPLLTAISIIEKEDWLPRTSDNSAPSRPCACFGTLLATLSTIQPKETRGLVSDMVIC